MKKHLTPLNELFREGTFVHDMAVKMIAGATNASLIESVKGMDGESGKKTQIYKARALLVKHGYLGEGTGGSRAKAGSPVVQFHPETKAYKIKALMDAGKSDDDIIKAGYTKIDLYSTRHQIKKKIEAGKPGKAIVPHEPKTTTLKAKKTATVKGKSHAPMTLVFDANASFDIPMVEAILHPVDGPPVRVFSSVDLFPQIYARAAKATGFL